MQFGFDQPKQYNHARDLRDKIKRYENQRHSKEVINTEASLKR